VNRPADGVFWRVIRLRIFAVCAFLGLIFAAPRARAWQYSADRPVGATAQQAPAWQKNAGIDQNLNRQLPLDAAFKDESGRDVKLGDEFGHNRPVMMALMYYNCQMLCPQVLHGMATALRTSGFHAGKDFDVVVTSIDPTDTPAAAAMEKQHFLGMLDENGANGPASAADSVHFLTGSQPSITELTQTIGFHYVRVPGPDGKMDQFAHSSMILIATPDGRMSKYLFGVDYQPRDVRLALIQASAKKIGSLTDVILLYCCTYSPIQGRYTVAVLRVLGLAAMGSVLAIIMLLYLLSKKPKATVTHA
jgi:protein SCO1/2